ncbi:hypothetical protein [Oricola cellulosilytica]|uniref:Uncharacterized protein n=1 Tax=Oricola cellulosilytica TaxID=1429082 RepID=A0A4R0PFS1_9HYPH|nr:hypothetical protein [Oricola cellulosilytica]TCD16491.1 hypothetical protein E0D97_03465 [Oricola cellulosilytica]
MSDLETALKNALAKGDVSNEAFRKRVYRAAATALERRSENRGEIDPQEVAARQKRLAAAIRSTEAEYAAADRSQPFSTQAFGPEELMPEVRSDVSAAPERKDEPVLTAAPRDRHTAPGGLAVRPEERERSGGNEKGTSPARRKSAIRRAPFATILTATVLVGLAILGAWWVISTGAYRSIAERDASVPNPPLQLENESFEGERRSENLSAPARVSLDPEDGQGWISLFEPSDPTTISLEGSATAAIDGNAFGHFARIVSPDQESAIIIDIPPGTLQSLAGRTAQFSVTARSGEDAPTQISITCNLAELGDCGRLRFNVTQSDNEFLFRVELPESSSISRAGELHIVTDLDEEARAVNLSSVRVREFDG